MNLRGEWLLERTTNTNEDPKNRTKKLTDDDDVNEQTKTKKPNSNTKKREKMDIYHGIRPSRDSTTATTTSDAGSFVSSSLWSSS